MSNLLKSSALACAVALCGCSAIPSDARFDGELSAVPLAARSLANGAACAAATDCTSSFCVDGVCCESLCTAQCASCALVGRVGRCFATEGAPQGGRPACPGSSTDGRCASQCDGVSMTACSYPDSTTLCGGAPACNILPGGAEVDGHACNGAGDCTPTITPCNGFDCRATGCLTSCAADPDCSHGNYCDCGTCRPFAAIGGACTPTTKCSTDGTRGDAFCDQGVCWAADCTAPCKARGSGTVACVAVDGVDPNGLCAGGCKTGVCQGDAGVAPAPGCAVDAGSDGAGDGGDASAADTAGDADAEGGDALSTEADEVASVDTAAEVPDAALDSTLDAPPDSSAGDAADDATPFDALTADTSSDDGSLADSADSADSADDAGPAGTSSSGGCGVRGGGVASAGEAWVGGLAAALALSRRRRAAGAR